MQNLLKSIPLDDGKLFSISGGRRSEFAKFKGYVEIAEETMLIPVLGNLQKGTKRIVATFVVCDDIEYTMMIGNNYIHTGKVYEAVGDIAGKRTLLSGLQFYDSDPIDNKLVFEVKDMELIEKLLKI